MQNKKLCLAFTYGKDSNVIGNNNELPWKLFGAAMYLWRLFYGNVIIVGRATYELLSEKMRTSKNVTFIVVTENPKWEPGSAKESCVFVANSFWEALERAERVRGKKVFVIGGKGVFQWMFKKVIFDEYHLVCVEDWINGDTVLQPPELSQDKYKKICEKHFQKKEGVNSHPFKIFSYEKR